MRASDGLRGPNTFSFGALACLAACLGCTPEPSGALYLNLVPPEFQSRFPSGAPTEPASGTEVLALRVNNGWPDAGPGTDPRGAYLWLVRFDPATGRGTRVLGEVHSGYESLLGTPIMRPELDGSGYSFVPSDPLDEGWYVLVAELAAWRSGLASFTTGDGYQEGDRLYARVHVGTLPTWWGTLILRGPEFQVALLFSEEVPSVLLEGTTISVRVDGVETPCTAAPSPISTWHLMNCPPTAAGAEYAVRLTGDFVRTAEGATDHTHRFAQPETESETSIDLVSPRFGIDAANAALEGL